MTSILRLCRPKHYLKNVLLFVPLLFGASFAGWDLVAIAFVGFSLLCSVVYVINDLRDRESDARHPTKKNRPLASGAVSVATGIRLLVFLFIAGWGFLLFACRFSPYTLLVPFLYLVLNILYSCGLKNYALIDVAILASGYLLRLLLGAGISGITISPWLYLVVLSISLYLSFGKRLGELNSTAGTETRKVLKQYNQGFLTSCLNVFAATAIVFYAMWACNDTTMATTGSYMLWSIPIVIFLYLRYRYLLDFGSNGDPVEVILGDKPILILGLLYALYLLFVYSGLLP